MGADMVVACVELKETKEEALERLAKLVINEETQDLFINEAYYFEYEEEDYTPELAEKMRKRIEEAVEVVYSDRRDITGINIDGNRIFVITGGMSWGDEPTDAMRDFEIFNVFLGYPSWNRPDSDEAKKWEESK